MAVVSETVRKRVIARAGGICEYCRYPEEFSAGRFAIDHILPRSKGGTDDLNNLARCCRNCNEHKNEATQARDPATALIEPLFDPRQSRWEDHFAWNEDYSMMIGLTASGRATIARIHTNHRGAVSQRQVLFALGLHPSP